MTWLLWRFGEGSVTTTPEAGPMWGYGTQGHRQRVYPPRVRDDVWVMPGDLRHENPARDTWEGEAT